MRILLFAQRYAPESVSGAIYATQLAEDLVARGHEVTFATGFPNYPGGKVYNGYRNKLYSRERRNGVTVLRFWNYTSPKKTTLRRMLNYGTFSASMIFTALPAQRPDVMMSYSPPLPLGMTAWLLSRLWRTPWLLRVEDIFPEAAIKAEVFRNQKLIRSLEWAEKFIYRKSSHISVISPGFRTKLLARGVPDKKISVAPVWADPDEVQPMPKQTAFRKEHNLENKFVVMYTGNLGYTSALEDVIDAAEQLSNEPEIRFVIIGEGTKKTALIDAARTKQLTNTLFLPYQPRERFSEILASADATLVTLNKASANTSLPSKLFNYLAASRPVIGVTPPESDLGQIIIQNRCGVVIPPETPQQLANTITHLRQNEAEQAVMGQRARELLVSEFSRNHCVDLYEKALSNLVKKQQ